MPPNQSARRGRYHFIGIGGIGMSALAYVLTKRGYAVSGSDLKSNPLTDKLKKLGATIFAGHRAGHVKKGQIVVYSSCIRKNNPEYKQARKFNNKIIHRADLLRDVVKDKYSIVVTGAHGKTTTSALIAAMFKRSKLDPTALIGGVVRDFHSNALNGAGAHAIVEADESDGSFLRIRPRAAIITNIDKEHMEHYGNMRTLLEANRRFAESAVKNGYLIYNRDDDRLRALVQSRNLTGTALSFAIKNPADAFGSNIAIAGGVTKFDCKYQGADLGRFSVPIPGEHNVLNALAAITVGINEGIAINQIREALARFKGTLRRFEVLYKKKRGMIVHDYAHHPREISTLIRGVRASFKRKKITVLFQPHRFSRTKDLLKDFAGALALADQIILTDIYSASEAPIKGITIERLMRTVADRGKRAHIIPKDMLVERIEQHYRPVGILLILGAGDIGEIARRIARLYEKRY